MVEPKESEIIKRIFREYLEGSSLQDIAKGLMDDGILTGGKRKLWRAEGVRLILRNEKTWVMPYSKRHSRWISLPKNV
ncbi:TPA: recombinase family protein [Streptococcus suis]